MHRRGFLTAAGLAAVLGPLAGCDMSGSPHPPPGGTGELAIDPRARLVGAVPGRMGWIAHTRRRLDALATAASRAPRTDPAVAEVIRAIDPTRSFLYGHSYTEPPILYGSFWTGAKGLRAPSLATPRPGPELTWWAIDWDSVPRSFTRGPEQEHGYVEDRRFFAPEISPVPTLKVADPTPRDAPSVTAHLGTADIARALEPLRGLPTEQNHDWDPEACLVVVARLGTRHTVTAAGMQHAGQRVQVRVEPSTYASELTTLVYALPLAELADETLVEESTGTRRLVDGAWA